MDNLIVCEKCGTTFSMDEKQCPICRSEVTTENYMGDHYDFDEREDAPREPERRHIGGKIAALLCLIVLFIGFTGYILYSFELLPFMKPSVSEKKSERVACTELAIDVSEITLTEAGQSVTIQTAVQPSDTTDRVIFSVDNSPVVSITQDGTVTAKAPGEANVTVMCGALIAYCKVVCEFDTADSGKLTISAEDISFFEAGEKTKLTISGGDGSEPVWESADEDIATVDAQGNVEAVGSGNVTIKATVGDETVLCIVRCQFER